MHPAIAAEADIAKMLAVIAVSFKLFMYSLPTLPNSNNRYHPLDRLASERLPFVKVGEGMAYAFPISTPAARTRLPPTSTCSAARSHGVSIYLF